MMVQINDGLTSERYLRIFRLSRVIESMDRPLFLPDEVLSTEVLSTSKKGGSGSIIGLEDRMLEVGFVMLGGDWGALISSEFWVELRI